MNWLEERLQTDLFFRETMKKYAGTQRGAVRCGEEKMTYTELWKQSNAAARLFSTLPRYSTVLICGDKENAILPCMYGATMGGCSYTFVPYYYPEDRVREIARACGAKVMLAPTALPHPRLEELRTYEKAELDSLLREEAPPVDEKLALTYDDVWAIYFTSGSTGKPKGVLVTGGAIRAKLYLPYEMFQGYHARYRDAKKTCQRGLNLPSYAFVFSLCNVYSEVGLYGVESCAVPTATLRNYSALLELVIGYDPVYIPATPSLVEVFLKDARFCPENLPSLRYISFGGEALRKDTVRRLWARFPQLDITNGYGTSETATAPFSYLVTRDDLEDDEETLAVGTEDDLEGVLLADEAGNPVPDGTPGELLLCGGYLSAGYLNDPELTARKFITDAAGRRYYRTDDIMVYKNGKIYYRGRKNNMFKVGGYRVEMEDVESNLLRVPCVAKCCVVPVMKGDSALTLAAYVVVKGEYESKLQKIAEIRQQLGKLVQGYMIPQKIVLLEELPKNNSGKVDRAGLTEKNRLA